MPTEIVYLSTCHCCGAELVPGRAVWLERSAMDNQFYTELPAGHVSAGRFPFRRYCARRLTGPPMSVAWSSVERLPPRR